MTYLSQPIVGCNLNNPLIASDWITSEHNSRRLAANHLLYNDSHWTIDGLSVTPLILDSDVRELRGPALHHRFTDLFDT